MNLILLLALLGFQPTVAEASVISQTTVEYSSTTAPFVLQAFAFKYKINAEEFTKVAECESGLRANAIGDHGNSYGVFQINLPSHPSITKEQALDPWFNIEWSAQQFAAGKKKMWTCARILGFSNVR